MILFVADQFADAYRDSEHRYPGGAELTDAAVIEAAPSEVVTRNFQTLTEADVRQATLVVVGNAIRASAEYVTLLASHPALVAFEHDLRICHHRGDFTAPGHPLHNKLEWCVCRRRKALRLMHATKGVIYLTEYQRSFYHRNPWYRDRPYRVLGSSVFDTVTINTFKEHVRSQDQPIDVAVAYSRHAAKGYEDSLALARTYSTDPFVVKDMAPSEVLDVLKRAKRFIHTPKAPEMAGRLPVEARFLGCEVITNQRVGVALEPWWSLPDDQALAHLSTAAARFWTYVAELI